MICEKAKTQKKMTRVKDRLTFCCCCSSLLRIGATTPYVMHALLAFSAMHIAFITDCPLVGSMAFEHRGIALSGLHEAIGTFSRETSDAILAASLVLSWQATDW